MRVLVCGGRDFDDLDGLARYLDDFQKDFNVSAVIHGGAPGADQMAGKWARENCIDIAEYPADWNTHGKAAGPIRNQRMLDEGKPDLVIAFPGGRGTADMMKRAKKAGIEVMGIKG